MTFKGDKVLEGGVYLIASSEKALMFDFIVSEMFFSLETDLNDLIGLMKVKNSFENDVFFQIISNYLLACLFLFVESLVHCQHYV